MSLYLAEGQRKLLPLKECSVSLVPPPFPCLVFLKVFSHAPECLFQDSSNYVAEDWLPLKDLDISGGRWCKLIEEGLKHGEDSWYLKCCMLRMMATACKCLAPKARQCHWTVRRKGRRYFDCSKINSLLAGCLSHTPYRT